MPIRYVSGDLFHNAHDAQAFAHGCNCQGSMGAGIAKNFRARYPEMYEEDRRRCKAEPRQFNLGECWLWKADNQLWVFNLGTQEGYWRARASYEAIDTALRSMRQQADVEGITRIAVSRIGVGYGGLSWKKVRAISRRCSGTGMARWWSTRSTCRAVPAHPSHYSRKGMPPELLQAVGCLIFLRAGRLVRARQGLRLPLTTRG